MRSFYFAMAVVLLIAGQAFAQSSGTQPSRQPSSQVTGQPVAPAALAADLEARMQAIEQKVQQLENRLNAVLPPAPAQGPAPVPPTDLTDRLDSLDAEVQVLEHSQEVQKGPTVTAGRDTFSISSPDNAYRLRIGGHLQLDAKFFPDNSDMLTNEFNLRRARPIFEGALGQYVDFRFMPDFGNGQVAIYDAYADIKASPYAVLRGGKFKTPLGLEQLQNDADLTFIERSLATDLVQNRDEGVQVYGHIHQRFTYQFAVDNGAPIGASIAVPTQSGKNVVERVFATPFAPSKRRGLKGLGFGIASSQGHQDPGATLPSFLSTGGQAVFFSYTGTALVKSPFADGTLINISPQAYYYVGRLGLMVEYVSSTQDIAGTTVDKNTIVEAIDNHAWQVAGSWMLTGERNSYKSIVPLKCFESGNNTKGWGAWELAARYSELKIDPLAFTSGLADITKSAKASYDWAVGLNWYLNFFTKLQFNYEQSTFTGGAIQGNRPTEHAIMERLQIAF